MGRPVKLDPQDTQVLMLLNGSHRLGIELGLDIQQMIAEKCDMQEYQRYRAHKRRVREAGIETKPILVVNKDGSIEMRVGK